MDQPRCILITNDTSSTFLNELRKNPAKTGDMVRRAETGSLRGLHYKGSLRILIDRSSHNCDELADIARCCCTGEDQTVEVI